MRKQLFRLAPALVLLPGLLVAQEFKLESLSSSPSGLPAAYSSLIDSHGYRLTAAAGPWCEIWFRTSLPVTAKPKDDSIVLPLPQGTLLAILRFPTDGYDRRGQTVKSGIYTLRYSLYPVDGSHQGVAPQRDFAVLTPLSADPDPNSLPAYRDLVDASAKGVGTPHPAVLSLECPTGAAFPYLLKQGESDWVLNVKIGGLPLAIFLAGKVEA